MNKHSLKKWIALPLAAAAFTCAADLDAAYGSGYSSYGNYQPYTGYNYNQQKGTQSTNPHYGPLTQGYQSYAAQNWDSNQQYWGNPNLSQQKTSTAVPFYHPGQQPQMPYGYVSGSQCPNVQYGMGQDLNKPNLFGQCLSPDPKNPTAGCPSGYRTGYSANYFSEPLPPVNSESMINQYNPHVPQWKAYGPQPSYTTYANQNLQQPNIQQNYGSCPQANVQPQLNAQQGYGYGQQNLQQGFGYGQQNLQQGINVQGYGQQQGMYGTYSQGYSCPGATQPSQGQAPMQSHSSMLDSKSTISYNQWEQGNQYGYSGSEKENHSFFESDRSDKNQNGSYTGSATKRGYGYGDNNQEGNGSHKNGNGQAVAAPSQNLNMPVIEILANNPNFSHFFKLLQVSGELNKLQGKGPFTIFAPTNAAFERLSPSKIQDWISKENKDKLKDFIDNHIVSGSYEIKDLKEAHVKALSGEKVDVTIKDNMVKIDDARIVAPNLIGTNGVVHGIDSILGH